MVWRTISTAGFMTHVARTTIEVPVAEVTATGVLTANTDDARRGFL
jgi:hypothetical protein